MAGRVHKSPKIQTVFKNLVFDWSGVINDNVDDHVNTVSDMFVLNGGRRITKRELRQKWTQPYMNFFNLYFPEWTLGEQRRYYLNSIKKFNSRTIYPGMKKLLLDLKKGGRNLYVISGDHTDIFAPQLKEYGLDNIFIKIFLSSHDKIDDLMKLLREEKLELAKTVFVGDTAHEIECAKAAKISSIGVTWGMSTPSRLKVADPTHLAQNPKQLRKYLLHESMIGA